MSQQSSASSFVGCRIARIPATLVICVFAIALSVQGCTEPRDPYGIAVGDDAEAIEIWSHPDTVGIPVYLPLDFKASSRTIVWAIDKGSRSVMRYEAAKEKPGLFGFGDYPPAEVVKPARLAVAENTGIFVFDDSTGMLDLYSMDGQHMRGLDPELRPSILEVARRPQRLTYGVQTVVDETIPTLSVIQTDFLGRNADTLLSVDVGPESLRGVPAARGGLISTPAIGGLWVFVTAMSDTVFEVSGAELPRKLALPETDTLRFGVIADLQQEILWILTPRSVGGLDLEAYDISDTGDGGVIDGRQAYLGARTTPRFFLPKVAFDGTISGWWRGENGVQAPRGYDMRIDGLRAGAAAAREGREARRSANMEEWARAIRAGDEVGREAAGLAGEEDPEETEEPGGVIQVE